MDNYERSRDMYEYLPHYSQPPLPSLPQANDLKTVLTDLNISDTPYSRRLMNTALSLSGYWRFLEGLPHHLEEVLRRSNTRGPSLYAPVVSATLAFQADSRQMTPAERAATYVCAARSFHADLWAGHFSQDTYKDYPLEMGQYPNLFGTSIIVENRRARLFKTSRTDQITVIIGNRIYLLSIADLEEGQIFQQLRQSFESLITENEKIGPSEELQSAGRITAASDRTQRTVLSRWQTIQPNAGNLQELRHSFLTICFDLDSHPENEAEVCQLGHSTHFGNRWFLASLQLIVFGNSRGAALISFSAFLDGNTMMRGATEIYRRAAQVPIETGQPTRSLPDPRKLDWFIGLPALEMTAADLKMILDNQVATFEIPGIGREFFNAHQVDAIPAFVLALHLAARRLTGVPTTVTQFLTMSRFRCLDVITPIVTTVEVTRYVEACLENLGLEERKRLMNVALDSQRNLYREHRQRLHTYRLIGLHTLNQRGFAQTRTLIITNLANKILTRRGLIQPPRRQILISHPEIYPEIPVVGRPGVRLPYVQYFGLHYQIWQENIIITMMPGIDWKTSNAETVAAIQQAIEELKQVITG